VRAISQYQGLEALYRELAPLGFLILGFPGNDFKGQEPGTPREIRQFCSTRYDVTFPLFEKVKVNGAEKCEIYRLLTANFEEPEGNFTKYLVDPEGTAVARYGPRTRPDDDGMRTRIEELLAVAAPAGNLDVAGITVVDFSRTDTPAWRSIDDAIMGGVSHSRLRPTDEGTGVFEGELALDNNGGFASVRCAPGPFDLSALAGLELRVRGDGQEGPFHLELAWIRSFAGQDGGRRVVH
jgi:glutathione peroxidase